MELLEYAPNPSAVPFHQATEQVKALMGPVGSGKSSAVVMEFFLQCLESPVPVRGLVLRESWPQLRDSTVVTWREWLPEPDLSVWHESERRMTVTAPGADGVRRSHTMDFRHARRAAEASNLLSTEYSFIWLEECVPALDVGRGVMGGGLPKDMFQLALTRQRQRGAHRLHIICSFNPPPKSHWCFQDFVGPSLTEQGRAEMARKGFAFFKQPPGENAAHLPPAYYDRLREQLSPELVRRFVDGEPLTVYPGSRVYADVIEDVHIVDDVPLLPGVGLISMHDFGRTPAALLAQLTSEGQLRVVRELQLWGAATAKLAEQMRLLLRNDFPGQDWLRGWGDPAGQNPTETDDTTSFKIMAKHGFPLTAGALTFLARREAVKVRCARMVGSQPALLISRAGCPLLCEALLGGYRYPQNMDGSIGYHPLKNDFSHLANCLEYGISGEFSYLTGDATQEPPAPVAGRFRTGYDPLATGRPRSPGWMTY